MKSSNTKKGLVIGYIAFTIIFFAAVLIIPSSREVFKAVSSAHPYLTGFAKFALLATSGELIAAYIKNGKPTVPVKIIFRFIIWGLIGIWITFMMRVFSTAVGTMAQNGMLFGSQNAFLKALCTSVIMNTTFGPTFMAVHKCTDKMLDLINEKQKISVKSVVGSINWTDFVGFTIIKTVPIFWIPAHTVTFLLPGQYQVMMAAALSVALGVILSAGSRKRADKEK